MILVIILNIYKRFSKGNKKVIGKMKDETKGVPIKEFVGLRSNDAYHYNNEYIKKIKRHEKKSVIKNDIKFDDYKITLFNYLQLEHTMNRIGSNNHNLKTFKIDKVNLSSFDN